MNNQEIPTSPESYVQAIFTEFGNVLFQLTVGKVTPLQLIALGKYLQIIGERQISQELNMRDEIAQRNRIIVPGIDPDGVSV